MAGSQHQSHPIQNSLLGRRIVVRCEGRWQHGLGHAVRSGALAIALAKAGAAVAFAGPRLAILRDLEEWMTILSVAEGPSLDDWENPTFSKAIASSDVLVTDGYAINPTWQAKSPIPVVAITDLPLVRKPHASLIVMPAQFEPVPDIPALLAPAHCLLRPTFANQRTSPKTGTRILIGFGAGYDAGILGRALTTLAKHSITRDAEGTIVAPSQVLEIPLVGKSLSCFPNMTIRSNVAEMAALTAQHDVALGAGGGSALERACLGLAQVLIPISENQKAPVRALTNAGAARSLFPDEVEDRLVSILSQLLKDRDERISLGEKGYDFIDGAGAARVAQAIAKRVV